MGSVGERDDGERRWEEPKTPQKNDSHRICVVRAVVVGDLVDVGPPPFCVPGKVPTEKPKQTTRGRGREGWLVWIGSETESRDMEQNRGPEHGNVKKERKKSRALGGRDDSGERRAARG